MTGRAGFRIGLGEATGAVADLGILVPLAAALILTNGLDAGAVFLWAGLLYLVAGLWFEVPFPVQPLKALTAVAVAEHLAPEVVHAAGIELGALLLALSLARGADRLARWFTKPVVRALQVGVGMLLVVSAWKLIRKPPAISAAVPSRGVTTGLAIAVFLVVALAVRSKRYWIVLVALTAGIVGTVTAASPDLSAPALTLPELSFPSSHAFAQAFWLLVVPQFPLTFGNAVVAVNALAHEEFGERARRVSPSRICITDGLANVAAGALGGMPMCHGSGGLTAHVRLGARTAGMNLLLGGSLALAGLLFADDIPTILGVIPVWVLAAFLGYSGVRHAWLAADLRGFALGVAVATGLIGAYAGNLAITAAAALLLAHGVTLVARYRRPAGTLAG